MIRFPHLMTLTYLSLAFSGCVRGTLPSHEDDREVLRLVMEHFSARRDVFREAGESVFVIDPKTQTWTQDESFSPENAGCKVPAHLYTAIAKRSAVEVSAVDLLPASPHWKISPNRSSDGAKPLIQYVDVDPSRKKPEIQIKISAPAFSRNGNEAIAIIRFELSIHNGDAYYLLERSGRGWSVSCSVELFAV